MSESDLAAQPNDAFFKEVFSQPEYAADFFRHHLPRDLAAHMDWPSLTLKPGSFVKQSLRQAHADLLFSIRIGDRGALLYLLFEHQTSPDSAMPLRLLSYMLEIWQDHEKREGLPLPPILPFVLHQGPQTWTVSTHFEDLLDMTGEVRGLLLPYLPKFSHALLDLTRFDPDQEEDDERMRVVLQLMKLAREKRVMDFLQWLVRQVLERVPMTLLRSGLTYAFHVEDHLDLPKIYHTLQANRQIRDDAMTIAETLRAEGKAEGKAEGQLRGMWLGKLRLLETLMNLPPAPEDELAAMDPAELKQRYEALQAEYDLRFKRA